MGMFDDVKYDGFDYQTKDLECQLTQFCVVDGRLIRTLYEWRKVEKRDEWEPPERLFPCGSEDTNYHGILNIYRMHGPMKEDWEELNLKFTDGSLVSVTPVPQLTPP